MSQMDHFEDELRNALRREDPPEGFAARVLARSGEEPATARGAWFAMPWLRLALAASVCFVAVIGARFDNERRQRIHGEEAKEQVLVALRVTGGKLHAVNAKVRGLSSDVAERR